MIGEIILAYYVAHSHAAVFLLINGRSYDRFRAVPGRPSSLQPYSASASRTDWLARGQDAHVAAFPPKGAPLMKAAHSESSAPGGARTPAPSTVGAIHLGTSARELRLVLSGLMLALTLAALDQNIVATALPRITGEFG